MAALAWPEREETGPDPLTVASQEGPAADGDRDFLRAVSQVYEAGLAVSFAALHGGERRRRVSVPTYPFQRKRFWVKAGARRPLDGHPLLGAHHVSASGEEVFETQLSGGRLGWLEDHRVFGRVVAPGALYGVQALSALWAAGTSAGAGFVEEVRIERPLVLPDVAPDGNEGSARTVQVILGRSDGEGRRPFEIFSRTRAGEPWVLHAAGQVGHRPAGEPPGPPGSRIEALREGLEAAGTGAMYRRLGSTGLELGPRMRGVLGVWTGDGEALGELAAPIGLEAEDAGLHPVLLDSCIQLLGAIGTQEAEPGERVALPVGWDRLWVERSLPDRIWCHARMQPASADDGRTAPDMRRADFVLYAPDGAVLGAWNGLSVREGSRSALLAASAAVEDLLYEVEWRDSPLPGIGASADYLASPEEVAAAAPRLTEVLRPEDPRLEDLESLAAGLEALSRAYGFAALARLGWKPRSGEEADPEQVCRNLRIVERHRALLVRILGLLREAGIPGHVDEGAAPAAVPGPEPGGEPGDPDALAEGLLNRNPGGSVEIALLRRCGAALPDVLRGRAEGLELLFGQTPDVGSLYRDAPAYRALNRVVAEAVGAAVRRLPEGRRLRVLEVGAGTGGTTAALLPLLPPGHTDYLYTDISSGFFADAETRFSTTGTHLEFKRLDIERDPGKQGFDLHRHDLVVAANVLHSTRDLGESLRNCRRLLAPSGTLVLFEATRPTGWADLTFGLLEGWWRFDDAYRRDHPLVPTAVWRQALQDSGFGEVGLIGSPDPASETGGSQGPNGAVILARGPAEVRPDPGLWVICPAGDREEAADGLVRELVEQGQQVTLAGARAGGERGRLDPFERDAWRKFFENLADEGPPLRGVVHLGAERGEAEPSSSSLPRELEATTQSALALLQGLSDAGRAPDAGLWFVTRGGQVLGGECAWRLGDAPLWGLGKTAALEVREFPVRMLDLDPDEHGSAERLLPELLFPDRESEAVYREGRRRVPRLVRRGRPGTRAGKPVGGEIDRLRMDRTYLVTGGLGGIGLEVARWLRELGVSSMVLNGRRPPEGAAAAVVEGLRAGGADIRVAVADVTDETAVARMVAEISGSDLPPLGGVIHSVGVLSDAALPNQTSEAFRRVLAPKALGAWHLHRATLELDPEIFVLFSSLAGVTGNPGQANHAAANAFLDQFAAWRRARGLPGQAIAWGAWSRVGEAEEARERIGERTSAAGLGWMTPGQGIAALERLIRADAPTAVAASVDWELRPFEDSPPLLEGFIRAGTEGPRAAGEDDLVQRLQQAPLPERTTLFVQFLQEQAQAVLRLSAPPAPDVGFFDLGMDSLMAVELRGRLNRALSGVYVAPNAIVFDYPTITQLARYLAAALSEAPEPAAPRPPTPTATRDGRIAVVGMACRFPPGVALSGFRELLVAGADLVTRGRPDGLMVDLEEGEAAPPGGYVGELDQFDAAFFGIAPVEAELLDPQQRLLLETSWEALEDAGLDPAALRGSRVGVYAGMSDVDYQRLVPGGEASLYRATGSSFATATGRVAFTLGFEGPAISVDTACSASLVAIHQAVAGLQQGDADLALAGGVNVILTTAVTRLFEAGNMLARDGRCKTFDAAADGFVRGEGCGLVVLKRLADAERDGDRILALVLGSAVNQDGASAGLTVPNGPAQERVIREALSRAGVEASSVDYLEAHGSGTELGDPIEVHAAAAVYGEGRGADQPLLIGSVKTNVGHLESAAGVAGVIKALLAMREGVIPRHLHFETPNPRIDWERLPVRVTAQATPWPVAAGRPFRAGVSSFGVSGTNAHLILEGYGSPGEAPAPSLDVPAPGMADVPATLADRRYRLLPLSARDPRALSELADRYREWIDAGPPVSWERLSDAAWTAGVGRSHFPQRAGLEFSDEASLRERLSEIAARKAGQSVGSHARTGEDRVPVHRPGESVGRDGERSLSAGTRGASRLRAVRDRLPGGAGYVPAGCPVRAPGCLGRPGLHLVHPTGPLCAPDSAPGPVAERRDRTGRGARSQRGGDRGCLRGRGYSDWRRECGSRRAGAR